MKVTGLASVINLCSPTQEALSQGGKKSLSEILRQAIRLPGLEGLWYFVEQLTQNSKISDARQFYTDLINMPDNGPGKHFDLADGSRVWIFELLESGEPALKIAIGGKVNRWTSDERCYDEVTFTNCKLSDLRATVATNILKNPEFYGQQLVDLANSIKPAG